MSTLLPPKPHDISLLYHTPRHPRYNPDTARIDQIVLSVTPTPGVYEYISYDPPRDSPQQHHGEMAPRLPRTLCFLHRPFALDRRRVRRGTLVLASHTSFDEHLTVGWNVALAGVLGVDIRSSECVQGYKGDAERKIGIVGRVGTGVMVGEMERVLRGEFGAFEARVGDEGNTEVRVMAIMNAFNAEQVERVVGVAERRGWIGDAGLGGGRQVLYLTGQPRESGMAVAKEFGLQVVCVGHRAAEEWGIRYMARRLRESFPGVDVKEVYEEEEPPVKKASKGEAPREE